MQSSDLSRRRFVKACAAVAALAAARRRPAEPAFALADAPRLKLVDKAGKPIKAGTLAADENYIFLYPYISTPCLLLRLGAATPRQVERTNADNARYTWPGGVGKDGAVVAYSAICAHAFSYDSRDDELPHLSARRAASSPSVGHADHLLRPWLDLRSRRRRHGGRRSGQVPIGGRRSSPIMARATN